MNLEKEIKLNGKSYTLQLGNSITASEFAKLGDVKISLCICGEYCYGPLPKRLPKENNSDIDKASCGSVFYADQVQSVVIYLDEDATAPPFLLAPIGEIAGDFSQLDKNGRIQMEIQQERRANC